MENHQEPFVTTHVNINEKSVGNVLAEKSYSFARRTIKLYRFLLSKHKEFVLSKQILRRGLPR